MEQDRKDLLDIILNDSSNSKCFDCKSSNSFPKYISINNGIFLCEKCARVHLEFANKSISNIIKNHLNNLNIIQLKLLSNAGNAKLHEFIDLNYPKLNYLTPQLLYKTNALEYYRKYLNYLVKGGEKVNKPDINVGYKDMKEEKFDFFGEIKNIGKKAGKLIDNVKNGFKNLFSNNKSKKVNNNYKNNNNYQNIYNQQPREDKTMGNCSTKNKTDSNKNTMKENVNSGNLNQYEEPNLPRNPTMNINQRGCLEFNPDILKLEQYMQ